MKLKFESKKDRTSADKFYQTSKKNECVVCGEKKGLIKYYIVPQCYRKHFPIKIKSHSSHDIVLLCHDCHQKSSQKEEKLRDKLCKLYEIDAWNKPLDIDKNLMNISKAAKTYLKCGDKLPKRRKTEILDMIQQHFDLNTHNDINDEILNEAVRLVPNKEEINELKHEQFGKHALDMVQAMNGDYMILIKKWRQYFVDEMKPQFLPNHWSVDSEY